MDYYQDEIASLWELYKVIRASKADARLVNNNLPVDIQKLRCHACYEALRFTPEIEAMGKLLVDRMRSFGPSIAFHLRFEDLLAFSGCTQDLTPSEADELRIIQENTKTWRNKEINPMEQRSRGYCPLTPRETGIFLSALGYPPNTPFYIAAGKIYGDSRMADLLSHFPILRARKHWHQLRSLNFLPIMRLKWLRLTTLFQLKVMYLYLHTPDTWRLQLKVTVAFLDTGKQYLLIEKPLFRCLTNLSRELLRKAKPYQIELFKCTGNGKAPHRREEVPFQDLGGRISFVQKNHFTRTPYQIVCVEKNSQCKELANHLIYFKMTKWVL